MSSLVNHIIETLKNQGKSNAGLPFALSFDLVHSSITNYLDNVGTDPQDLQDAITYAYGNWILFLSQGSEIGLNMDPCFFITCVNNYPVEDIHLYINSFIRLN